MTYRSSTIGLRLVVAVILLLLAQPARAQGDPILGDVSIITTPECTTIRIGFQIPILYLRHFPYESGETLLVFVRPMGGSPRDAGWQLPWETALLPPSEFKMLRDIVLEGDAPGGPYLEIFFTRELAYEVRQDRNYRGIVVYIPSPGASEPCPLDR